MRQFASVRFAEVLDDGARDAVTSGLRSAGATPSSWATAGGRTYATLLIDGAAVDALRRILPGASVAVPPRAVLRIVPDRRERVPALASALAGPGGWAGIARVATDGDAVVIEVDVSATPLPPIVSLVDAELGADRRRIEPVLPLGDDEIAALAGAALHEPDLTDASRLIETYLRRTASA